MPKIIVQSNPPDGAAAVYTLQERLTADNLESAHYTRQLVERIVWAVADAETIETVSDRLEPTSGVFHDLELHDLDELAEAVTGQV